MSKSKSKRVPFTTPPGTAKYPHITERDTGHKFSSNKFDSRTVHDGNDADVKAFIKLIDDAVKANIPNVEDPKLPYKLTEDGRVEIKAKSDYQPMIFDSQNRRVEKLPVNTRVAGGSTIRMAGTMNFYDKGVSLWLNQVQILELVDGMGDSMFEPSEGSFSKDELDEDENTGAFDNTSAAGGPDI